MISLISIIKKKNETERLLEKFGNEKGSLYIKLWKQRTLRLYITSGMPDFQSHLTEVLLDRFDDKVQSEYPSEIMMDFRKFLIDADNTRLFREADMKRSVGDAFEKIKEKAAEDKTTVQQAAYSYFLENYDI